MITDEYINDGVDTVMLKQILNQLYQQLKKDALANGRSLAEEIIFLLDRKI